MKKALSPKTLMGLVLSLAVPVLYGLWLGPVYLKPHLADLTYPLISFGVMWLLALLVVGFTLFVEKQSLRTIGWQKLSWKAVLGALLIGVLLSLFVPVFTLLVNKILPANQSGSIAELTTSTPWWVILLSVVTAAVTEEVLFRAYPIERLLADNKHPWLGAVIGLVFFILLHAAGWNLVHLVGVVIPLGLVLTGLYLWRRNLPFVILVHLMIDLPLVVLALAQ